MPAVQNKATVEKQASADKDQSQDPLKQIHQLVEKKIRNLEKRKGKLDILKKEHSDGKALNEDQRKAVSKFDDVVDNLEFLRDFSKSVQKLVDEALKERKRQEKEQAKKNAAERERLKSILTLQHVLSLLDDTSFRSVLLKGTASLQPISEEKLKRIDQFRQTVILERKITETNFGKQMDGVADRLSALAEGRKKDAVKGMTYAELKDLLLDIQKSGFTTSPTPIDNIAVIGKKENEVLPMQQQQQQQQAEGSSAAAEVAPSEAPLAPTEASVAAVYSFGTVPGIDGPQDQDPAVVSMIPGFATQNGAIPSQIYTNPSYTGVYVPVTGPVVPGAHILSSGQLIAAQHYPAQPGPNHLNNSAQQQQIGGQQTHFVETAHQQVDQATFSVSNLNLNDGRVEPTENEFRQKDSRRNKSFQPHGFRRDARPNKTAEFHGSSNGFQRRQDRYQGNNRDLRGNPGDRKPFQSSAGRGRGPGATRGDRPAHATRTAAASGVPTSNNNSAKQWSG